MRATLTPYVERITVTLRVLYIDHYCSLVTNLKYKIEMIRVVKILFPSHLKEYDRQPIAQFPKHLCLVVIHHRFDQESSCLDAAPQVVALSLAVPS